MSGLTQKPVTPEMETFLATLAILPKNEQVDAIVSIVMYQLDLDQITDLKFRLKLFVDHPQVYTLEEIEKLCAKIGPYHNHVVIMNLLYTLRHEMEAMCEALLLVNNQMHAKTP